MSNGSWRERAAHKVAQTASKIPSEWRISPQDCDRARTTRNITGPFIQSFLLEREVEIVELDSESFVRKIASKSLSSLEVANAYCKTAAIAHQIVSALIIDFTFSSAIFLCLLQTLIRLSCQNNCLHEIFFEEALACAKFLDQYLSEHGRTIGTLHGLPISLKDQFHVKGNDTTMGYIGWIDTFEGNIDPVRTHKVESQVVGELYLTGAVLYCKVTSKCYNLNQSHIHAVC
jgi:amidase